MDLLGKQKGYRFLVARCHYFDQRKNVTYIIYFHFSYSASLQFSGITHNATAFVGCDAGKV
jgi:hypothetical protein